MTCLITELIVTVTVLSIKEIKYYINITYFIRAVHFSSILK